MITRLNVCMGGRVAQELIFGEDEVTLDASSDLEQATHLACAMDTKYGKSMNTKTRLLIKKEVRELLEFPFNNAKNIFNYSYQRAPHTMHCLNTRHCRESILKK
ncbi:putative peptidase M41 [Helianthus annuus]|nr:putative peptidase M41 [Helianthus annuus]